MEQRECTMPDFLTEILTSMVPAAVGAIAGWMLNSTRKASKADLTQAVDSINERLDEIEHEQKAFITRAEFRDALSELKGDIRTQHEALLAQMQQLNQALLNRQRPTNP